MTPLDQLHGHMTQQDGEEGKEDELGSKPPHLSLESIKVGGVVCNTFTQVNQSGMIPPPITCASSPSHSPRTAVGFWLCRTQST